MPKIKKSTSVKKPIVNTKKVTPLSETPYKGTRKSSEFDKMYDKFQIVNNRLNANKKKK